MSSKIKFLGACLVLITIVSVYQFFISLEPGTVNGEGTQTTTESLRTNDTDKDGLADTDESVWNTDFMNPDTDGDGFLDGEEVASGHDPLIAGPKDSLIEQNLTDKMSDVMIGGLFAQDLKAEETNKGFNTAIDNITLSAVADFYTSTPTRQSTPPQTTNATQAAQEQYLQLVADAVQLDIIDFSIAIPAGTSEKDYYLQKGIRFRTVAEKLRSQVVPKGWTDFHGEIVSILERLAVDYRAIGNREVDPLKAMIAITEIEQLVQPQVRSLLNVVQERIIENRLVLQGTFYEVLGLIY